MNEQLTNFGYWQTLWREADPATRRRRYIALAVYLGLWLLGSLLAPWHIAGIAAMSGLGRFLGAVIIGPFGIVWVVLQLTGFLVENTNDPGLSWLAAAGLNLLPLGYIIVIGIKAANPDTLQKREAEKHRRNQGQLEPDEAAEKLPLKTGIPMAIVQDKQKKPVKVGMDFANGQGHVLVTAPTRGGKGLQLTDLLFHWPGAAVIVDPKAEQYKRTAGFRRRYLGPVYHLPGHQVQLARYYDFLDPDDIQELHDQLLRPDEDMQRIFADKSLPLFRAVGHFARARKCDPLRVLLDAAEDDFQHVLAGLDSVPAARPFVRQFTNGQPPDKVTSADRFVSSAYGTFATRLFAYQKHIDTICPRLLHNTLPREWAAQQSSLYITYSLNELEGVGGVVAAILAGLMRDHMAHGQKRRLLVAIDEMAAVRLRHLDTYLATVGGYGITIVLYAQSTSQLEGIYGRAGAEAILANCAHQLWYPPNDFQTAQHISDLYGTTLKPSRSYSTVSRTIQQENGQMRKIPQQSVSESLVEGPTYSPSEVWALAKDKVFVFTEKEQRFRFIGQRLDPRSLFEELPEPPSLPVLPKTPRRYTEWLPVAGSAEEASVMTEDTSAAKSETDSTTLDTPTTSGEPPLPSESATALPEDAEPSVAESSVVANVPNPTAEETPVVDDDDDERTLW